MWVAPARIFWKDFERRESVYVLRTAIPNPKDEWVGTHWHVLATKNKIQIHQLRTKPN